ncbi:MAG: DUF1631 family protein [Massilia sp.]
MAPSTSQSATQGKATGLAKRELLLSLVTIVTRHLSEHSGPMMTAMVAGITDVSNPSLDAREVYLRIKSGNLLKDNTYAFVHLATDALEKAMRHELAQLAPAVVGQAQQAEQSLALVPLEEMDRSVAFGAISRAFEIAYSEQIASLNVRLGTLLGADILRINQNPFRPEVILMAINAAWCDFEPDAEAHPLILPLLVPSVVFDFAPVYEALNLALMHKGVVPGSAEALRVRKKESAAKAKAARADTDAALADQLRQFLSGAEAANSMLDNGIPLIPDLPNLPQGRGGWRPSGADGFAVPEGADTAINIHTVQHSHQPSAPGAAAQHGHQAQHGTTIHQVQHGHQGGAPANATAAAGFLGGALQAGSAFAGAAQAGQAHAGAAHPGAMHGGAMPAGVAHAGATHGGAMQAGGFQTGGFQAGGFQAGAMHGGAQPGGIVLPAGAYLPESLGPFGYGPQREAGVPATTEQLLAFLGQMQGQGGQAPVAGDVQPHNVFYLPRLKQSMPEGSLTRADEGTIDLLSRIFETVHLDDHIPQETRELIHHLQVPVLKAALQDKNFFFQEAHPARRMIDLMSRMGWDQRGPDDPLFQAMQRSVERVGQTAGKEAEGEVFAEAVAELEATIQAEEKAAAVEMAAPIAQALKQEKTIAATRSAKSAVALRLGSGDLVPVVESFLEQKWTSVLTVAYGVEDDKPGAVNNATKTMDDLIWSVKPKSTHEQRRALIAKLPGMLSTLNKWLDIIKWQDAERLQFFAELAKCHASIVRAPIEVSPERQLELAAEAAKQDALRRIEREQALAAAEEAELDQATQTVDALERGMWFEFTLAGGQTRQVKLAWISPLRSLFIFSTGARQEAFSMSSEKLAEAYRANTVRMIRQNGVVARALSEAMGGGAVNDPEGGAPLAAAS